MKHEFEEEITDKFDSLEARAFEFRENACKKRKWVYTRAIACGILVLGLVYHYGSKLYENKPKPISAIFQTQKAYEVQFKNTRKLDSLLEGKKDSFDETSKLFDEYITENRKF